MTTHFLTKRNLIMAFALVIAIWLRWEAYHQEDQVVGPVRVLQKTKANITDYKSQWEDYNLTPRNLSIKNINDLFSVPQKRIEKKQNYNQPAKPIPPPLPFKYLGLVQESSMTKLILDYQGEVLALKEGDTIGQVYKLSTVTKIGNSTQLQFLYLPMNITQSMVVSDGK